ncbi:MULTISPECIES: hypothetical protein [unclassified Streptomyces]|uniref:hypothetical protein n=1 Tax=unclassified Streptomyces TaxID=2593676 RepID=UPI000CD5448A|nr:MULTISPECIES: hypothetical protein [unclassified Streptomyces]AWL39678.1 hypothetical protein B9S64_17445 [Streptomyces sp. SM18]
MSNRKTLTPDQVNRRRRLNKKILGFGCLPITVLLILVIVAAIVGSNDTDLKDEEAKVRPAYTIANKTEKKKTGSVDLVIPDATVDQAKAAVEDYAQHHIGDRFLNYSVTVVRSDTDKVYVCMGEWVKDEQASQVYTGGRVKGDNWPALTTNCPDPKS